ncbi:hypothetical protein WN51_05238 [Melipona quadrifasciata]|uniref:Uncharacterized protein n=1 Tax=Melipona quadrifasciata TaxID=166423 RepID=A0A0N0BDE3_9HYME|nr:hypothetical protein WN51_05238 [Melipona quadrifasciata]
MKLAFRLGSICDKKVVVASCCCIPRCEADTIAPAGLRAVANLNSFRVLDPLAMLSREQDGHAVYVERTARRIVLLKFETTFGYR